MKTINTLLRQLSWAILGLMFAAQLSEAQNNPAASGPGQDVQLPGSAEKVEDVASGPGSVFIGTITQWGFVSPGPAGVASYADVQVKVSQVLRGVANSAVSIYFDVKNGPNVREWEPQLGITYIFIAKKSAQGSSGDQFTILKLLPATDDNIAKVKARIAAAPAGK